MNCPKCGLQTAADQKFCRSCGAGLQVITQPLTEQAGLPAVTRKTANTPEDEKQRGRIVLWGLIMMFIGVAIGVIGKMLMHEDIVTVVGVLLSLVGMFLTVYPYLSPSPSKKSDFSPSSPPEILTESRSVKSLPRGSNTDYVPSITERTTSLLESSPEPRTAKKKIEDSEG